VRVRLRKQSAAATVGVPPNARLQRMGRVVHGHSSHHPKGVEVYRQMRILYGCGDFLNDYEGIPARQSEGVGSARTRDPRVIPWIGSIATGPQERA
jgi:Bacterial capsule synthesis protein PGA_cap